MTSFRPTDRSGITVAVHDKSVKAHFRITHESVTPLREGFNRRDLQQQLCGVGPGFRRRRPSIRNSRPALASLRGRFYQRPQLPAEGPRQPEGRRPKELICSSANLHISLYLLLHMSAFADTTHLHRRESATRENPAAPAGRSKSAIPKTTATHNEAGEEVRGFLELHTSPLSPATPCEQPLSPSPNLKYRLPPLLPSDEPLKC
jgi:hypothetical protein